MRALALALSVCSFFAGMSVDLFPPKEPEWVLCLVNRDNRLPHTYVPTDLVMPEVAAAPYKEDAIYLRREAAEALEALFYAAAEAGHTLYAVSGYRSYALQKSIYDRKVESSGEKRAMLTVAKQGASEHQLGLAMDINGESTVVRGLVQDFGDTPEGKWVYENAHFFGFILRYQQGKTAITGYAWEPWHLRYVGQEAAKEIASLEITFEEYHAVLQQRRIDAWIKQEN